MEWGRDWRKLYRHPSQEWLALPVMVRGFGDEMLRYADDPDGRLYVGNGDPIPALARLMSAHVTERKAMAKALELLLADGYAVRDGAHLIIRNFLVAQTAVSPSGERMRKLRARATDSGPTDDDPSTNRIPHADQPQTAESPKVRTSRKDSAEPVTVASPIEETRREESNPPVVPPVGGTAAHAAAPVEPKAKRARRAKAEAQPALPMPWTIAAMLDEFKRVAPHRMAVDPFPQELATPLTSVIRAAATAAIAWADMTLVAEYWAAGGQDFLDAVDAAWLAKGGNLTAAVARARKWHAAGRTPPGQRRTGYVAPGTEAAPSRQTGALDDIRRALGEVDATPAPPRKPGLQAAGNCNTASVLTLLAGGMRHG